MPSPHRRRRSRKDHRIQWRDGLTNAVDIGIVATVTFAPLFMGGRGPIGRLVFVLCVAITALLWCVRQCLVVRAKWRMSGVEWLLIVGLGVLLLQLAPLSQQMLSFVSPHIYEMLPLWAPTSDSTLQLGTWNQASLHPMATQSGLATYVAYAVLFLVTIQRLDGLHDIQRLLRLIAVATCLMAVLGLAQFFFSNGRFLWVFDHVSRDTNSVVLGPFHNQNHFAHLLALGIGPLLWWLTTFSTKQKQRQKRSSQYHSPKAVLQSRMLWTAIGTVTFAALLTFSRGGVVVLILAAMSGVALLYWKNLFSRQALNGVAIVACLMVGALSIYGYEPLARRLGTLGEAQSIDELSHGRWALWSAHVKAIPDFWMVGTGVGTHRDIYPTYLSEHFDVEFTHGESGYMQLMLETGILGSTLFLVGIFYAFRWTLVPFLRGTDKTAVACAAAIIPGILASVVHSLADFVWYIPACMTTTVLLLAAGCRLYQCSTNTEKVRLTPDADTSASTLDAPRMAWCGATLVCVLTFAQAVSILYKPALGAPHWYDYRRFAISAGAGGLRSTNPNDLAALADRVVATLAENPNDSRAHTQLAALRLQQFDVAQQQSTNPMPLSQIREAAIASDFSSQEKLDEWLDLAVGDNRKFFDSALVHAQKSVRLCPLQGESYTLLANVSFLEQYSANRKRSYVQQALLVRPHHSRVRFVAGQEALMDGQIKDALTHWKLAFHGEREVQRELIGMLTTVLPADDLLTAFAPDSRALELLLTQYKASGKAESAKTVAVYYTRQLEEQFRTDPTIDKSRTLERLSSLHEYLGSNETAFHLAQEALKAGPWNFNLRLRVGRKLIDRERYTEAQTTIKWCTRRQPEHKHARNLLEEANRGAHMQQADRSAEMSSSGPSRR